MIRVEICRKYFFFLLTTHPRHDSSFDLRLESVISQESRDLSLEVVSCFGDRLILCDSLSK